MRKVKGFTLIELMIVVAIIAILAAIAYPSYQRYVVETNRSAAEQFMLELSNRQEQYLLDARRYTNNLSDLGYGSVPEEVNKNYSITVTCQGVASCNDPSPPLAYTITATPKAGTPQAGEATLSLTNTGVWTES